MKYRPAVDMMFCATAQSDVAPAGRNDAMFAATLGAADIISEATSLGEAQHHLPKANIIEKSTDNVDAFFWWGKVDSNHRSR